MEDFRKLKDSHAAFHKMAAKIATKALTGNKAEAQELLAGEYRRTSVQIGGLLANLHAETKDGKK